MRNYNMISSFAEYEMQNTSKNSLKSDISFPISENIRKGAYIYEKPRRTHLVEEGNEPIKGETTICYGKKHTNLFALVFSIAVVLILAIIAGLNFASSTNYTTFYRFSGVASADEKKPYKSMVVIEPNSKCVLESFNENEKLPMASTTKIMTAIIAIENNADLTKVVPAPREAVGIEGTSIYLRENEELSIKDLLYGLILASGNDSASALAIITSGSEDAFVQLMNDKVAELGLKDTHFTNPHGLHDDNHYTSALDLAKITAYALQNDVFREIVATKRHTIAETKFTKERYLKNKQKLLFDEELNSGELQITGVKSGFTPEAGRCLVTSGYKGNMNAICVVFNCPDMFEESKDLIQKALNGYVYEQIIEPYDYLSTLSVIDGDIASINVFSESGFSYPIKKDEKIEIKTYLEYPKEIYAPISENQEIGKVLVCINGEEKFSAPIKSMENVKNTNYKKIAKGLIEEFI